MNYSEACAQLGLESNVELTDVELKKAFKKAALKHHPDKNLQDAEKAKENFQRISTAYDFLTQCVTRGQTGPNQPRFATSDEPLFEGDGGDGYYYDDEDDSDEYFDMQEALFSMLFAKMHAGGGGGRSGGFGFSRGGSTFFVPPSHSNSRSPYAEYEYSYGRRHSYSSVDDDDDDDDLNNMFDAFAEQARRKEEARQQARKREQKHAEYMAERARQAQKEGREFFEAWNVKQLMGECKRRGVATRGKQQKDIIEALIQDEAKKRLRVQLKEKAPLLDEWVEVIHMKKNAQWNGMKVRVIDFFDDMDKYLVEWDLNASKKKTKNYLRESKTARIKPENLRLWATGQPMEDTSAAASTGSDKENTKQQESQQQNRKKKSKNGNDKKASKKESPSMAKAGTKPEVSNTKCCAICHKEHDLEAEDARAVILPCAHIFCEECCGGKYLPDATSDVEIRSCRVCHKCDPGIDGIKALPYVADLQDPPEVVLDSLYKEYSLIVTCESVEALEKQQEKELQSLNMQKAKALKEQKDIVHNKANHGKMNKDKKGKLYKQAQGSVEAEFGPKRQELLQLHEQLWRSVSQAGSLRELHEQRDKSKENATNAIAKHYRRASLAVHPDRHGDTFQREFDALTKARDTLSEVDLRHKYMEQMLQVVSTVGTHWLESSHAAWVRQHQPDMAEKNSTAKNSDAPGNQPPLQIEGGLMHTKPRRPNVAVLNVKERRIRVTLRIPGSSYEFCSYATALHIMGDRADIYNEEFEEEYKQTILREGFNSKCDGEIEVDMTLPEAGLWDIRWMYTIEMDPGCPRDSEQSTDTRVDLVSPKYKAQLKLLESFESVAVRRKTELRSALRHLATTAAGSNSDVQTRYETLQEATLRAKHAEYHLAKAMTNVGANLKAADTPLARLRSALADTRPYKEELDLAMVVHQKKAGFKNFKQTVFETLESGDGSAWVAVVTAETLKNEMKGDANRLYQLLMEGKKSYKVELVDAATLFSASHRNDLFSAKQLKALCERSEIVEIRAEDEARRMMIDNEKKESAENTLRSLQEKANEVDCERGALVQIVGLNSEPSLNGKLATFMGLGQGERFTVRLNEDREIALRRHNFRKYDGVGFLRFGQPPLRKKEEWTCAICTYLHEGPHVENLSACSMCCTLRHSHPKDMGSKGQNVKPVQEARREAAAEETGSVSPQGAQPQKKTGERNNKMTSGGSFVKSEVSSAEKKKAEPTTSQRDDVVAPESASPSPRKQTSESTKTRQMPQGKFSQGVDLTKYVVSPPRKTGQFTATKSVTPKTAAQDAKTQTSSRDLPSTKKGSRQQNSASKPEGEQKPKNADVTSPTKGQGSKPQKAKKCSYGTKCRYLKSGKKCRYEHTPEDLALAGKARAVPAPATPATVAESLNTRDIPEAAEEAARSGMIEMTIFIASEKMGFVLGPKKWFLQKVACQSGAHITASSREESIQEGQCSIQIRAYSQKIIDHAASLFHERVDKFRQKPKPDQDVTSTESCSSSVPSVINGSSYASPMAPTTPTPTPCESPSDQSNLRAFLVAHKKALKCTPENFMAYLCQEDVESLDDLREAIEDELFVENLLVKGLKRFKMAAFLQNIETALRS